MKKILFVGAEAMPFAATGGLGDVLGSLPAALAQTGDADVRVVHRLITTHGDYTAPKVNSGLGTADSADDLPRLILLCKRARRAIFAQSILSVLGCFGGVALALTLGVFGVANLPCSLVAVGLQAAIALVQTLFGKLYLHSVPEIK